MSRSFAALLLLAFVAAVCAQAGAVPPLEGTVIRRLGNTNGRAQQPGCSEQPGCFTLRSAVELHDPALSPASDWLARLRRAQVERQEEKPAVDRHGDPLPRTHADKQSAVTLLQVSGIGCHRMPDAPAQWGQAVSDASRMPRRSVAGVLGASAGVLTTRSGAASWLLFDSGRSRAPEGHTNRGVALFLST
jgi:hypothetical protein